MILEGSERQVSPGGWWSAYLAICKSGNANRSGDIAARSEYELTLLVTLFVRHDDELLDADNGVFLLTLLLLLRLFFQCRHHPR